MKIYLSPSSTQSAATLLTVESYLNSLGHQVVATPAQAELYAVVGSQAQVDPALTGRQVVNLDVHNLFQQPTLDLQSLPSYVYPTEQVFVTASTTTSATVAPPNSATPSANHSIHVVAVTACPTGVAHTFMAAEAIEKYAKSQGWDIKVETRGQVGVGTPLTAQDIAQADLVFIACDIDVNLDMFTGKRLYQTSTALALKQPGEEFAKAFATAQVYGTASTSSNQKTATGATSSSNTASKSGMINPLEADFGNEQPVGDSPSVQPDNTSKGVYKHLMTGVSYMLPVTIAGGLAIALSFAFGIYAFKTPGTIPAALMEIGGGSAFKLMLAIFSGYVAFSIADRPGLAPGLITGFIATNLGAGFLGAIITGFISGYVTRFLNQKIQLPASVAALKPILLLPFLSTLIVGLLTIYLIGPYVTVMVEHLKAFITSMSGTSSIILGMILGAMMCIDLGGPINKAAYVVAVGLISDGVYTLMASVMAAGMVPPLGMAIATWLARSKFNPAQRSSGNVAFVLGLCFISEGAIPFAAVDPIRVLSSTVVGGAIAGALSMYFNVQLLAPHGGIFVVFTVNHVLQYLAAIAIGSVITGIMYAILKPRNFEV